MEIDEAAALIESAMGDVKVIVCPKCLGLGEIRGALHLPCPRCKGAGETTESENDGPV